MASSPSPEFRLVCACCRWPRGEAREEAVRTAAAVPGLDWGRVAAIAQRQRVWGLVADGLEKAGVAPPGDVARLIRNRADRIAQANLAALAGTAELGALLDRAGIDWISFKGLPLAVQAYGSLKVKMSNDVDILVPLADAERGCALLREAGYIRFNPGAQIADDQVAAWMRVAKETGWRHPVTGLIVELHGRVMANPALLPEVSIAAPRKRVEIGPGVTVETLPDDLLFPYLAAHGAHHGWFRVKWLADAAALLMRDPAGIEAQYRRAQQLGVGRCAAQAMLLAQDLLALPLQPAFAAELRASKAHRRLVEVAMGAMAGAFEAREHGGAAARSLVGVTFANLMLRRGLGYKWRELTTLAANPADRATGRLPQALAFLYPLLGGVRWSARMMGLIGKRRAAQRAEGA